MAAVLVSSQKHEPDSPGELICKETVVVDAVDQTVPKQLDIQSVPCRDRVSR